MGIELPAPKVISVCPNCGMLVTERLLGMCARCLLMEADSTADSRDDPTPVEQPGAGLRERDADASTEGSQEQTGEALPYEHDASSSGPICPAVSIGQRIGQYELLEVIGEGGMGVVYRARQASPNRIVALKILRPGVWTGTSVQRFAAEADAAGRLVHSNIVPVFEAGTSNGIHYLAMSFVPGGSLAASLESGPLSPRTAAELARQIADAAAHAHENGIVHRDIKPSNLLLDQNGNVLITDFGLARRMGTSESLTQTGQVLGTACFMSPEQAAGSERVGPLSDMYSIGAVLYCLLTGRPPFQAENLHATLRQVSEEEPVNPARLNSAIDRDLDTICMKCLEKPLSRRYGGAHELSVDLQRWLEHRPILARPISVLGRMRRWSKRNPYVAMFAVALTLSVMAGVIGIASQWQRAERAFQDSQLQLFDSQLQKLRLMVRDPAFGRTDLTKAYDELRILSRSVPLKMQRGNERTGLVLDIETRRADVQSTSMVSLPDGDIPIDFSPDLQQLACRYLEAVGVYGTSDAAGLLFTLPENAPRLGDNTVPHRDHPDLKSPPVRLLFDPTGRYLAVEHHGNTAQVWDLNSRETVTENPIILLPESHISFRADESRFLAVTQQGVQIHNLETGQVDLHPHDFVSQSDDGYSVASMHFIPGANRIAMRHNDGRALRVVEFTPQSFGYRGFELPRRVEEAAWNQEGDTIALRSDGQIEVVDVQSHQTRHFLLREKFVRKIALSPSGDLLAAACQGKTYLWDTISGSLLRTNSGEAVRFSNDGKRLAWRQEGAAGLWRVTRSPSYQMLSNPSRVDFPGRIAIDVSGQVPLVAVAGSRGISIRHIVGHQLVQISDGNAFAVRFLEKRQAILTSCDRGIWLWPMAWREKELKIGPPKQLFVATFLRHGKRPGAISVDGKEEVVAAIVASKEHNDQKPRVCLIHIDTGVCHFIEDVHRDANTISIHPDRRFLAVGAGRSMGLDLWKVDPHDFGRIHRLDELYPSTRDVVPRFSPNGQQLGVMTDGYFRMHRIDSFKESWSVSTSGRWLPFCFTSNAGAVLIARSRDKVQWFNNFGFELTVPFGEVAIGYGHAAALARDKRWLAITHPGGFISRWDFAPATKYLRVVDSQYLPRLPSPHNVKPDDALLIDIDRGDFVTARQATIAK